MPSQTPDVSLGMTFEHAHGSAPDLVDVFDLPGRVMQERHRGRLEQQVVMVGGASQEGSGPQDLVTYLEPDAIDEEALRSSASDVPMTT